MPPGGRGSFGRGGSRTGWAAIAGIVIGALLLAGVEQPDRTASARPAALVGLVTTPCTAQKSSSRSLAVRRPQASTDARERCAERRLYP
jgi:hypothetical protein